MGSSCLLLVAAVTIIVSITITESRLEYNYYESLCPNVESIVRKEVLSMMLVDTTAAPQLVRLFFHECQAQGCDASILVDTEDSEIVSPKNFGIKMREGIERIKYAVEAECPDQVSCADIIVLAAKEAVALSGGPRIEILLGRKDSTSSSSRNADVHIPSPDISVNGMLNIFRSKGMNLAESVAIMGAHTLGVGHCISIVDRLYNPKPNYQIDNVFEAELRLLCPHPIPLTNITFVPNDLTPSIFDNQYFRRLLIGKVLFGIDSGVSRDPRTSPIVGQFAVDQNYFFEVFSSAFVKLSSVGVLSEGQGEIRKQCNRRNM